MLTTQRGTEFEAIGGPADGMTVILPAGVTVFCYRLGKLWARYRLVTEPDGLTLRFEGFA